MLKTLRLRNFRCFDDHTIPLRQRTLIIGRNNAGKSTVVEGLRLVALVANRFQNFQRQAPPSWLELPQHLRRIYRGVTPSLRDADFNFDTLFHRYGDPPARITALFGSHQQLELFIGPQRQLFAMLTDQQGAMIGGNRGRVAVTPVSILPQIGPLSVEERLLTEEHVKTSVATHLASMHFRNQIARSPDNWNRFCTLAEQSWPGLSIQELMKDERGRFQEPLQLMIRDGDFVAEVGRMGHGLQMWLQTMWFLARSDRGATVILDEPDVYMHSDLQRRLIRFLPGRHHQVVIATHSVEMLAEVNPDEVLIIDRTQPRSAFASSLPAVQQIVDRIGGVHNLQLARLWNSRRVLLIEGDDVAILRVLHNTLFPGAVEAFDAVARVPLGGWSGFPYALGARLLLQNAGGESITPYCLLDSDYHTPVEISERYESAARRGVQLHIWTRKELENFLLVPGAVQRVIESLSDDSSPTPTVADVVAQMNEVAESLKLSTTDALASEFLNADRRAGLPAANAAARMRMEEAWETFEGRIGAVSGKAMFSGLSQWSQAVYGASFSAGAVARAINIDEIATEVAEVLGAIERCENFGL